MYERLKITPKTTPAEWHNKLGYLMFPYTGDFYQQLTRASLCSILTAELLNRGFLIYSPIQHSSSIGDCLTHAGWMRHCLLMLQKCDYVLYPTSMASGRDSMGMQMELEEAQRLKLPIIPVTTRWLSDE